MRFVLPERFGVLPARWNVLPARISVLPARICVLPARCFVLPVTIIVLPGGFSVLPGCFSVLPARFSVLPAARAGRHADVARASDHPASRLALLARRFLPDHDASGVIGRGRPRRNRCAGRPAHAWRSGAHAGRF
jgi:hypothetical protein